MMSMPLFLAALSLSAPKPTVEPKTDRPGSDYTSLDLDKANPQLCKDRCASEERCVAYTYVKPGVQGPKARCWLKDSVPNPTPSDCCVSGVKPGPKVARADVELEPGIDRPGSDYRSFDLEKPEAALCKDACTAEAKCVAFTYVNPGVQGPMPRCWLKNAIPATVPNACCVSGVTGQKTARDTPLKPISGGVGIEVGVDRPGSDLKSFDLTDAEPALCRDACALEAKCVAFTYVKPGVQGPSPRCWLKDHVPAAAPSDCCASGLVPSFEPGKDRPGEDMKDFDLPRPEPGLCRQACAREASCAAFTYVQPDVQGPSARCWLKQNAPAAEPNDCCTSGARPAH
ncbi:MAG: PAN domain-containing protein [Deltaproteobacteria bacterium]|nr:PAN domain-containing protein [Deltaproteobacteria bacterium]